MVHFLFYPHFFGVLTQSLSPCQAKLFIIDATKIAVKVG